MRSQKLSGGWRAGFAALWVVALLGLSGGSASAAASGERQLRGLRIEPATASLAPGATLTLRAFGVYDDETERDLTSECTFASNRPEVVSVSGNRLTAIAEGNAEIAARHTPSGETADDRAKIEVSAVVVPPEGSPLRGLRIEPATASLAPGATLTLRAFGVYEDETERDLTSECTFASNRPEVVSVSGNRLRALREGNVKIAAEHTPTGEAADDEAEIEVPGIEALTLSPTTAILSGGQSVQIRALAQLADGQSGIDVTELLEWGSTRGTVGSVSNTAGSRGRVKGHLIGTTEIEARDPSSGTRSERDAVLVEVTSDDPAGGGGGGGGGGALDIRDLVLEPTDLNLLTGETHRVVVRAQLGDGSTLDVTSACTFESTRARSATVSTGAVVAGVGAGRARIRVRHSNGAKASRDLEVWVGEIEQIALTPIGAVLELGASRAFSALATYDNGRSADITTRVRWSLKNVTIASVGTEGAAAGRVTATNLGETILWAHDPLSGERSPDNAGQIIVVAEGGVPPTEPGEETPEDLRALQDLVFEPSLLHLLPGESRPVRVIAVYRDGSRRDISDRVEVLPRNRRVVEVDASGLVTALSGGSSELQARDPDSRRSARTPGHVTVASLVGLRIDPPSVTLARDETVQFRALADYSDGSRGVDVTTLVNWESNRDDIATVDQSDRRGLVTALRDGVSEIGCEELHSRFSCDRSTGTVTVGTPPPGEEPVPGDIVDLVIEPPQLAMELGSIATVSVLLLHADGSTTPVTENLRMISMARSIVATASGGKLQARRGGSTEVEVTHQTTGLTKRFAVLVRTIERIYVDPPSITLRSGQAVQLRALADMNDGTHGVDVTAQVRWDSLDRSVVEMDREIAGRVIGIAAGSVRVEIRHDASRTRSDASTGTIRISDTLRRLSITPALTSGRVGDQVAFNAIGTFADGATTDITTDVIWRVTPIEAGTVDEAGRVRILQGGSPIIVRAADLRSGLSSTLSGGDGRIDVTAAVLGLQVGTGTLTQTPTTITLAPGETARLVALAIDGSTAAPLNVSARVIWASTDAAAVSVEATGLVTCQRDGQAVISATDPVTGLVSTNSLGNTTVVCGGAAVALRIEPAVYDLDYKKTRQLRAFRVYLDGHEVEVTYKVNWSSADPKAVSVVATGASGGRVTAHDDAIVTISAHDPAFDLSSDDNGGGNGVITVRKTRTRLQIFPIYPVSADSDGVWRGPIGQIVRLKAKVTYATGATQGVNLRVQWISSAPTVVQMGDGVILPINNGTMLRAGETTITALWPPDEASAGALSDTIEVEVTG